MRLLESRQSVRFAEKAPKRFERRGRQSRFRGQSRLFRRHDRRLRLLFRRHRRQSIPAFRLYLAYIVKN